MNRLLCILVTISLALWAGALAHLVLTATTLFAAFPKNQSAVAIDAAPQIFRATEQYLLALCLISVLALIAWRLLFGCSRAKRGMKGLAVLATVLVFVQSFSLSAKMESLRQSGQSGGPEFSTLHHLSTAQYMIQTIFILGALALLPSAITSPDDRCKFKP